MVGAGGGLLCPPHPAGGCVGLAARPQHKGIPARRAALTGTGQFCTVYFAAELREGTRLLYPPPVYGVRVGT